MARLPRLSLPGIPQHVVQQGNNLQTCFFTGSDYDYYLDCLREGTEKYDVMVHAYSLLANHLHLLMTPSSEAGISRLMQYLGRRFVRYINDTYQRSGTLWEGRYHASLIDSDNYLLSCQCYIELSPVRLGMVDDPREYPWSSYHYNAFGERDALIVPHAQYLALGQSKDTRHSRYRKLCFSRPGKDLISSIEEAAQGNRVLGSEDFIDQIEQIFAISVRKHQPGRPRLTQV